MFSSSIIGTHKPLFLKTVHYPAASSGAMFLYLATENVMLAAGGKKDLGKQVEDVAGTSLPQPHSANATAEMRAHPCSLENKWRS